MGNLLSNCTFYACIVLMFAVQALKCDAQSTWTPIPFGTSRTLNEIEYFDYNGTAIAADSGLVIWKKTGTQNWVKLQLPSVLPIVSLDRLTYDGSNHSYNYFISSGKKAYKLNDLGTDLVEDTLPGWPLLAEKANRLVNLHISTIS